MRYSKQRELVLQKVEQLCDHPTAEEIFDLAARECPGLSLGTVYRNLNSLVASQGKGLSSEKFPFPNASVPFQKEWALEIRGFGFFLSGIGEQGVAGFVRRFIRVGAQANRYHGGPLFSGIGFYDRQPLRGDRQKPAWRDHPALLSSVSALPYLSDRMKMKQAEH